MKSGAAGRYGRFLALAALVAVALGGLGAPWTRSAEGDAGVPAMVLGLALCWVAAAVGGVPLLTASRRAEGEGGPAVRTAAELTPALAAMGIRLAVVVVGAAAIALGGAVPRGPFLLWTGIGYVAMLVVETRYAVGEVRRLERSRKPVTESPEDGAGRTRRRDAALTHGSGETETR